MSVDKRVVEALTAAFEGQHTLFWHDTDQEFAADVAAISAAVDAELVRVRVHGVQAAAGRRCGLGAKRSLEINIASC